MHYIYNQSQITISESVVICQIINGLHNNFCEYLSQFLAVRLYSWHNSKEPADCKLIHETVQQLHAKLSQSRGAIQWHQFNGS